MATAYRPNDTQYDIICVNAQSVLAKDKKSKETKIQKLEKMCKRFNVSILCCTEARITEVEKDELYTIDGYYGVVCHSLSRHTGGVVMYIKNDLNYKSFPYTSTPHIWCLAIEITNSDIDGIYGGIYRYQDQTIKNVDAGLKILDDFLNNHLKTDSHNANKRQLFMGDMNIDFRNPKKVTLSGKANEIFKKHNLIHALDVNIITRTGRNSETHIDVVVSNCKEGDVICEILKDVQISDHETIGIRIKRSESVKVENQKEKTTNAGIRLSPQRAQLSSSPIPSRSSSTSSLSRTFNSAMRLESTSSCPSSQPTSLNFCPTPSTSSTSNLNNKQRRRRSF
ncbi:uncharacterized protein LOC119077112 isoform X1 [Bradysia coprophila]|uniref:uncharacterized protein LOC119077112 isoform X1 n=1 Tax=Bradysia coprophila TaxID=38358 RepID=UPI00187DB5B3|nr:uncharacterized protein LOC119077112 isoform X1 [Bradysia coprophila]